MIAPKGFPQVTGSVGSSVAFATAGEAVKVRDRLLKADSSVAVGEMSRQVESG